MTAVTTEASCGQSHEELIRQLQLCVEEMLNVENIKKDSDLRSSMDSRMSVSVRSLLENSSVQNIVSPVAQGDVVSCPVSNQMILTALENSQQLFTFNACDAASKSTGTGESSPNNSQESSMRVGPRPYAMPRSRCCISLCGTDESVTQEDVEAAIEAALSGGEGSASIPILHFYRESSTRIYAIFVDEREAKKVFLSLQGKPIGKCTKVEVKIRVSPDSNTNRYVPFRIPQPASQANGTTNGRSSSNVKENSVASSSSTPSQSAPVAIDEAGNGEAATRHGNGTGPAPGMQKVYLGNTLRAPQSQHMGNKMNNNNMRARPYIPGCEGPGLRSPAAMHHHHLMMMMMAHHFARASFQQHVPPDRPQDFRQRGHEGAVLPPGMQPPYFPFPHGMPMQNGELPMYGAPYANNNNNNNNNFNGFHHPGPQHVSHANQRYNFNQQHNDNAPIRGQEEFNPSAARPQRQPNGNENGAANQSSSFVHPKPRSQAGQSAAAPAVVEQAAPPASAPQTEVVSDDAKKAPKLSKKQKQRLKQMLQSSLDSSVGAAGTTVDEPGVTPTEKSTSQDEELGTSSNSEAAPAAAQSVPDKEQPASSLPAANSLPASNEEKQDQPNMGSTSTAETASPAAADPAAAAKDKTASQAPAVAPTAAAPVANISDGSASSSVERGISNERDESNTAPADASYSSSAQETSVARMRSMIPAPKSAVRRAAEAAAAAAAANGAVNPMNPCVLGTFPAGQNVDMYNAYVMNGGAAAPPAALIPPSPTANKALNTRINSSKTSTPNSTEASAHVTIKNSPETGNSPSHSLGSAAPKSTLVIPRPRSDLLGTRKSTDEVAGSTAQKSPPHSPNMENGRAPSQTAQSLPSENGATSTAPGHSLSKKGLNVNAPVFSLSSAPLPEASPAGAAEYDYAESAGYDSKYYMPSGAGASNEKYASGAYHSAGVNSTYAQDSVSPQYPSYPYSSGPCGKLFSGHVGQMDRDSSAEGVKWSESNLSSDAKPYQSYQSPTYAADQGAVKSSNGPYSSAQAYRTPAPVPAPTATASTTTGSVPRVGAAPWQPSHKMAEARGAGFGTNESATSMLLTSPIDGSDSTFVVTAGVRNGLGGGLMDKSLSGDQLNMMGSNHSLHSQSRGVALHSPSTHDTYKSPSGIGAPWSNRMTSSQFSLANSQTDLSNSLEAAGIPVEMGSASFSSQPGSAPRKLLRPAVRRASDDSHSPISPGGMGSGPANSGLTVTIPSSSSCPQKCYRHNPYSQEVQVLCSGAPSPSGLVSPISMPSPSMRMTRGNSNENMSHGTGIAHRSAATSPSQPLLVPTAGSRPALPPGVLAALSERLNPATLRANRQQAATNVAARVAALNSGANSMDDMATHNAASSTPITPPSSGSAINGATHSAIPANNDSLNTKNTPAPLANDSNAQSTTGESSEEGRTLSFAEILQKKKNASVSTTSCVVVAAAPHGSSDAGASSAPTSGNSNSRKNNGNGVNTPTAATKRKSGAGAAASNNEERPKSKKSNRSGAAGGASGSDKPHGTTKADSAAHGDKPAPRKAAAHAPKVSA